MIKISISAEAYREIRGRLPDPTKRDDTGGYALVVDPKTLDRLTALRTPESYSDVILRLARPAPHGAPRRMAARARSITACDYQSMSKHRRRRFTAASATTLSMR